MSFTRKQNGRIVVAPRLSSGAHGRIPKVAPAARVAIDVHDPAERFAAALVECALAKAMKNEPAKRSAKQRRDRARAALVATPGGLDDAKRIALALGACGAVLLRAVERAAPEMREHAARAAVRLVALVREHDARTTSALVLLASAAQWTAIGEMLRERLFTLGPKGDGFGEAMRLARDASATGRNDLLSALALEREARDAERSRPFVPPTFAQDAPDEPDAQAVDHDPKDAPMDRPEALAPERPDLRDDESTEDSPTGNRFPVEPDGQEEARPTGRPAPQVEVGAAVGAPMTDAASAQARQSYAEFQTRALERTRRRS